MEDHMQIKVVTANLLFLLELLLDELLYVQKIQSQTSPIKRMVWFGLWLRSSLREYYHA